MLVLITLALRWGSALPVDAGKYWDIFHSDHKLKDTKGSGITKTDDDLGHPSSSKMAESVKAGFLHAWRSYRAKAWGFDEIKPVSNQGLNNWGGEGALILDSLDTMMLMGLDEDVAVAKEKVEAMDFHAMKKDLSVFELNIRYIGGLLAAHGLSGDEIYLNKAKELADFLLPAFATPTRFPKTYMNINKGMSNSASWLGAGNTILADIGTLQLEWVYLSHHLGDPRYANLVLDISERISSASVPKKGMYPTIISYQNAVFSGSRINWGAMGDSFYEYLLKYYLVSGRRETKFLEDYLASIEALKAELIAAVSVQYPNASGETVRKNFAFVAQMKAKQKIKVQDHLACFLPGLLALGAHAFHSDENPKDPPWAKREPENDMERALRDQAEADMTLADEILEGCVATYLVNSMGLGSDVIDFKAEIRPWSMETSAHRMETTSLQSERAIWQNVFNTHKTFSDYMLRPETVESLYVLHKVTGHPKYRAYAWKIWQAIEKWCKTPFAYSAVKKTDFDMAQQDADETDNSPEPKKYWTDKMETFFLAETIKYLYLIFLDEDKLPIHQFIFNTEAHPLPVFDYERGSARFTAEELQTGKVRPWKEEINSEAAPDYSALKNQNQNQENKAPQLAFAGNKEIQRFGPPNPAGSNHYVYPGSSNYPKGMGGGDPTLHKAICVSDEETVNTRCCYDGPCGEIGWNDNGLGDPNICGGSDEAGVACSGRIKYKEAITHCQTMGGRLCTKSELERWETMGTGCLYDVELLWTQTKCEATPVQLTAETEREDEEGEGQEKEQEKAEDTDTEKKKTKKKKNKEKKRKKEKEEEGEGEGEENQEVKSLEEMMKAMEEKLKSLRGRQKKKKRKPPTDDAEP